MRESAFISQGKVGSSSSTATTRQTGWGQRGPRVALCGSFSDLAGSQTHTGLNPRADRGPRLLRTGRPAAQERRGPRDRGAGGAAVRAHLRAPPAEGGAQRDFRAQAQGRATLRRDCGVQDGCFHIARTLSCHSGCTALTKAIDLVLKQALVTVSLSAREAKSDKKMLKRR